MVTEAEFVMIKCFDRTVRNNTVAAQRIIDRKNTLLEHRDAEVARLRGALAAETGRRRLAQLSATTGARRLAMLQARSH